MLSEEDTTGNNARVRSAQHRNSGKDGGRDETAGGGWGVLGVESIHSTAYTAEFRSIAGLRVFSSNLQLPANHEPMCRWKENQSQREGMESEVGSGVFIDFILRLLVLLFLTLALLPSLPRSYVSLFLSMKDTSGCSMTSIVVVAVAVEIGYALFSSAHLLCFCC